MPEVFLLKSVLSRNVDEGTSLLAIEEKKHNKILSETQGPEKGRATIENTAENLS